jgi:hypothetical protein
MQGVASVAAGDAMRRALRRDDSHTPALPRPRPPTLTTNRPSLTTNVHNHRAPGRPASSREGMERTAQDFRLQGSGIHPVTRRVLTPTHRRDATGDTTPIH